MPASKRRAFRKARAACKSLPNWMFRRSACVARPSGLARIANRKVRLGETPIQPARRSHAVERHAPCLRREDHLPLYRLENIFARQNIEIAQSTMGAWIQGFLAIDNNAAERAPSSPPPPPSISTPCGSRNGHEFRIGDTCPPRRPRESWTKPASCPSLFLTPWPCSIPSRRRPSSGHVSGRCC